MKKSVNRCVLLLRLHSHDANIIGSDKLESSCCASANFKHKKIEVQLVGHRPKRCALATPMSIICMQFALKQPTIAKQNSTRRHLIKHTTARHTIIETRHDAAKRPHSQYTHTHARHVTSERIAHSGARATCRRRTASVRSSALSIRCTCASAQ
jgi:hypothetical protein